MGLDDVRSNKIPQSHRSDEGHDEQFWSTNHIHDWRVVGVIITTRKEQSSRKHCPKTETRQLYRSKRDMQLFLLDSSFVMWLLLITKHAAAPVRLPASTSAAFAYSTPWVHDPKSSMDTSHQGASETPERAHHHHPHVIHVQTSMDTFLAQRASQHLVWGRWWHQHRHKVHYSKCTASSANTWLGSVAACCSCAIVVFLQLSRLLKSSNM